MAGRKHHIRPLSKHKKIHVKAECDHCHKWECLTAYEDDIGKRDFMLGFFECQDCRKTYCIRCQPDQKKFKCPSCGSTNAKKVKPIDIYVCGVCLREWFNDKLCSECDYEVKEENPYY